MLDFLGVSGPMLAGIMQDIFTAHGPTLAYILIFVVLVLTGSGLPIPEEVPIITAAFLSVSYTEDPPFLHPWIAFASCFTGALVGDAIMYYIGYHFGKNVLREHPWWARYVSPEREAQMEDKFHEHGFKVLFIARFLVGIRSPVYLTAGILRLPFRRFIFVDFFCATIVVGMFFWVTYLFGPRIAGWIKDAQYALTAVVVVSVLVAVFLLWRHYRLKKSKKQGDPGNEQAKE